MNPTLLIENCLASPRSIASRHRSIEDRSRLRKLLGPCLGIALWMALGGPLATSVLAQAKVSESLSKAVENAPDVGGMVAVLVYGEKWSPTNEKYRDQVFLSRDLASKLSANVQLVCVGFPEVHSEAEKLFADSPDRLPRVGYRTFPTVLIFDGTGKLISMIQPVATFDSPLTLATELETRHGKMKQRDETLQQAAKVEGVEKAKLLGQMVRDLGVGLGPWLEDSRKFALQDIVDQIKAADPNDESGWGMAIGFPIGWIGEHISKLNSEEGLEQADAYLDRVLAIPQLLPEQRQQIELKRYLLYKSIGQPLEKQIEILEKMTAAAPETLEGRAAVKWANHLRGHLKK